MPNINKTKFGCHVSLSAPDYLIGSLNEAQSYGADCFMIYTGAPQNTTRISVERMKIELFHEGLINANIAVTDVIVHAPYILNMANTIDSSKAQFAVDFMRQEVSRTQKMGLKYLVAHPGNHLGAGIDAGLNQIVNSLNQILLNQSEVTIALETMAGKGTELGVNFDQIKYIIDNVEYPDNVKICIDTCHLNDAGYDLTKFDDILDEIDSKIGLDKLVCVHLNNSKNIQGSHKDRHANLDNGEIAFNTLYDIASNERIVNIPKILETPYIDGKVPYKEEIMMLKKTHF